MLQLQDKSELLSTENELHVGLRFPVGNFQFSVWLGTGTAAPLDSTLQPFFPQFLAVSQWTQIIFTATQSLIHTFF